MGPLSLRRLLRQNEFWGGRWGVGGQGDRVWTACVCGGAAEGRGDHRLSGRRGGHKGKQRGAWRAERDQPADSVVLEAVEEGEPLCGAEERDLAHHPLCVVAAQRGDAGAVCPGQAALARLQVLRDEADRAQAVRVHLPLPRPRVAPPLHHHPGRPPRLRHLKALPRAQAPGRHHCRQEPHHAPGRDPLLEGQRRLEPLLRPGEPRRLLYHKRPRRLARLARRKLQRLHPLHANQVCPRQRLVQVWHGPRHRDLGGRRRIHPRLPRRPVSALKTVTHEIQSLFALFSEKPLFGVAYTLEEGGSSSSKAGPSSSSSSAPPVTVKEEEMEIVDVPDTAVLYVADGDKNADRLAVFHPGIGLAIEDLRENVTLDSLWRWQ